MPGSPPTPPSGYVLVRQGAERDRWHAVALEGVSVDALRIGLPMDPPPAPGRAVVSPGAPSDFLELPCPLVSDAMRRALDDAGVENVEYFPVEVTPQYADDGADAVRARYWAANVVGAVACAVPLPNRATGGVAEEPDAPTGPFAIDAARAAGVGLFRLAEDRRLLVASPRVAAALHGARLRGVVLQDPATYTGRRVRSGLVGA